MVIDSTFCPALDIYNKVCVVIDMTNILILKKQHLLSTNLTLLCISLFYTDV